MRAAGIALASVVIGGVYAWHQSQDRAAWDRDGEDLVFLVTFEPSGLRREGAVRVDLEMNRVLIKHDQIRSSPWRWGPLKGGRTFVLKAETLDPDGRLECMINSSRRGRVSHDVTSGIGRVVCPHP